MVWGGASDAVRQRRFAVPVADLVAFLLGHEFGGAMQALFGLNHLAGSEAVLTVSARAEFDQIGAPHRAHDFVELLDPVAVPVREHRHDRGA